MKTIQKDASHMQVDNEPAIKRNESILNDLLREIYTVAANYKIPDNYKYSFATIQADQNQKETSTGGLTKLLKLKICATVMLTVVIYIQDRLINGQTGNIRHTEFLKVVFITYMQSFVTNQLA